MTSVSASTPPMTPPPPSSTSSDASGTEPALVGVKSEKKFSLNTDKRVNPFKKKTKKPATEDVRPTDSSAENGDKDQLPPPKPTSPPPKPPPWPDAARAENAAAPPPLPSAGPSSSSTLHGHSATDAVNLGSVSVVLGGKETTEFAQITAPMVTNTAPITRTAAATTEPSSRLMGTSERKVESTQIIQEKEEKDDESEGKKEKEGEESPPMSIEDAVQGGFITPTDYRNLDRAEIYEYDPKRPPAICSGNGGGGADGLHSLRSLQR